MNVHNKLNALTLTLIGVLSIAGCDMRDGKIPKSIAKTTVGMEVDDSVATTAVKSALLKDTGLGSSSIGVETSKD